MKKSVIIRSLVAAAILTVLGYFVNNLPFISNSNQLPLRIAQKSIGLSRPINYDDAVFVNVSYDKKIVPAFGPDGEPLGGNAITDREKLASFIDMLHRSDTYKYILLDMVFEDSDSQSVDDSLFSVIGRTQRLAFVTGYDKEFDNPELAVKAAYAHYYILKSSGDSDFSKYEFSLGDERYVPLKAYEDLYPDKKFKRFGWKRLSIYHSGRRLCHNSLFLTFDNRPFMSGSGSERHRGSIVETANYYNLGADFINLTGNIYSEEEMVSSIAALANGRTVVIGNFIEDVHNTYIGDIPGPLILYRAFQSLEEGMHYVHWWQALIWFLCWFLTGLLMRMPWKRLHNASKGIRLLRFAVSIISFTAVFTVLQALELVAGLAITSIALPILYFTVLRLTIDYDKAMKS